VSEQNYDEIVAQCPKEALLSGEGMSAACKAAVNQMQDNLGSVAVTQDPISFIVFVTAEL